MNSGENDADTAFAAKLEKRGFSIRDIFSGAEKSR